MVEEIQDEEEEEQVKLEPKVEFESLTPCKLKVKIEISAEKVTQLVDRKFSKLNDAVQVPGFRKGHAPRNLLERKFGKDLLEELKTDIVQNAFKEAADEKKIEAIQEPVLLDAPEKLELKSGSAFSYLVEIEVLPKLELKPYVELKVQKVELRPTDEEVREEIEALRDERGIWEPFDGEALKGDQAVTDLTLIVDGKELTTEENTPLILVEDIRLLHTPLPEFHKVFLGQRAGAAVEYSFDLAADLDDSDLAGKNVTIRAVVKGLKRKKLPELDADFLKKFDCDSLEELQGEVRKRLQKQKDAEARTRMASDLLTQIFDANDVPLPEGLVKQWIVEHLKHTALDMVQRGVPEEQVRGALAERRVGAQDEARRALKQHLMIDHISKKEKLFVTEDDVDKRIDELAAQMGRPAPEVHRMLDEQGLVATLRRRMKIERVLDFLLSKAQIE